MADPALLAIDQGTTSSRAIVFDAAGAILSVAQRELTQIYPRDGWVEHDPEEIWADTMAVCGEAIKGAGRAIAAIGITNQRETTIVWDRKTGTPIHNAIVWQDRRGAPLCAGLRAAGREPLVREKTGLVLDSYFSATKLAWLLEHVDGARAKAEAGDLAFGTVDSFLLWRLTGGTVRATDATNASRTMLFDIARQDWDDELLDLFGVPKPMLPRVLDSAADFGATTLFGESIPITGIAGDQHAATVGQACFAPGMIKSTYGTGAFIVLNTGTEKPAPGAGILGTVAYRIGGTPTYAVEGSIFNAGTVVQWLRDTLGFVGNAAETEALARGLPDNRGVYMVPAFTGLGAPHWDPNARGAIFGLTRDTGIAEIVRAGLESVCYQTRDMLEAMDPDGTADVLRVDGGMVGNDWLMQFLADILGAPVERPAVAETTALGAACLAGLQVGVFGGLEDITKLWTRQARFDPVMADQDRAPLLRRWRDLVGRVREPAHR